MDKVYMRNPVPEARKEVSQPLIMNLNREAARAFYESNLTAVDISKIFSALALLWDENQIALTQEKHAGRREYDRQDY